MAIEQSAPPKSEPSLAMRASKDTEIASLSLTIRDLQKSFGDTQAIDGTSLEVPAGKIVALLGPSGCGKTTLLRCIAGLEKPDRGEILIGNTQVYTAGINIAPERRGVGMVFQDCALFPHATVAQNVGFGLSRKERRSGFIHEVLSLVGIQDLGDRSPETLSGGQQQRVALARALAHAPSVILLDEPFSNLDALLRVQLRREISDVMRELNVTAVVVSHDQGEAFEIGDQVAVMIDGVIQQQAEPNVLYENPNTREVAEFVGDANILSGYATGSQAETSIGHIPLNQSGTGPVELIVRPERVEIIPGGTGIINAIDFYGHDATYKVKLPDDKKLTVRILSAPKLQIGDHVTCRYIGPPVRSFFPHESKPKGNPESIYTSGNGPNGHFLKTP